MERITGWLRANRARAATIVAILLALAGGTVALVIDVDGPNGPTPPRTITFAVNAAAGDGWPTRTLAAPAPAVDAAARSDVGDHAGSGDESPAGVPQAQLDASRAKQAEIRRTREPLSTAGASQGFRGCRTAFQSTNWSSRNGVRPNVITLHYTVSPRLPGLADVLGIAKYLALPSTRASAHFIIDDEGNCLYTVPIEHKAWTQAGGNPYTAASFEVIARGDERQFMTTAGYAALRGVLVQVSERTGIPLRRGAVSGCVPTRSGIVHHADGGACWGGHHDINPFSIDEVIARVATPPRPPSPLTAVEQRIVRGVERPAGSGHSRRYWCQRAQTRRLELRRLGRAEGWRRRRGERFQLVSRAYAERCR